MLFSDSVFPTVRAIGAEKRASGVHTERGRVRQEDELGARGRVARDHRAGDADAAATMY